MAVVSNASSGHLRGYSLADTSKYSTGTLHTIGWLNVSHRPPEAMLRCLGMTLVASCSSPNCDQV
eukprot:scaffold7066_cov169-Skeletonema_marinoi.AAC.2